MTAISGTGGGGRREWTLVWVDRLFNNGREGGEQGAKNALYLSLKVTDGGRLGTQRVMGGNPEKSEAVGWGQIRCNISKRSLGSEHSLTEVGASTSHDSFTLRELVARKKTLYIYIYLVGWDCKNIAIFQFGLFLHQHGRDLELFFSELLYLSKVFLDRKLLRKGNSGIFMVVGVM